MFSDIKEISQYAKVSNEAFRLMRLLLPGPYTFILPLPALCRACYRGTARPLVSGYRSTGSVNPLSRWWANPSSRQVSRFRTSRSTSTPWRSRNNSGTWLILSWTVGSCPTYHPTILSLETDTLEIIRHGLGSIDMFEPQ